MQIIIYRRAEDIAVVMECVADGRRWTLEIATLPLGYGQTARMLGEVVGAAHNIPISWSWETMGKNQ